MEWTQEEINWLRRENIWTNNDVVDMLIEEGNKKLEDKIKIMEDRYKNRNVKKYRWYFITLTDIKEDPKDLIISIKKIINSKLINVIKYLYCFELTKDGIPHIHMVMKTDKYVKARDILNMNNGKRIDISLVKSLINVINYICKEEEDVMKDYLIKYNIEKFYTNIQCLTKIIKEKDIKNVTVDMLTKD